MELFQTAWKCGSYYTKGMTSDEFFYSQVYDAVKDNLESHTLPFFNQDASKLPVEISSGKLITDENLIPLELIASKNGYESNLWIYGSDLEKMQKEGISLTLKKGAQPVLCKTRYENATHIQGLELYVGERGANTPLQFMYNYDSFDEKSKRAVEKYFKNAAKVSEDHTLENFRNFTENLRNMNEQKMEALNTIKKNTMKIAEQASSYFATFSKDSKKVNLSPLINAQAKHLCQESTGGNIRHEENNREKEYCYSLLSHMVMMTEETPCKGGKAITDALNAGTQYAKSCTSKDLNRENRKIREEEQVKKQNIFRQRSGEWEY